MKYMMFAHGGSMNRGCEAIVRSSAAIIKQRSKGAKVYLTSGRPETDQEITQLDGIYDGSESRINKYSFDWLIVSLQTKIFRDDSFAFRRIHRNVIKQVKDMDVCLSIGGDNYCYGEQPGLYEIDRRIKKHGKKLVLWGGSIGEEDLSPAKLEDLKLFDLILARESLTYNLLKAKGLQQVKLCADPAFTLEKEELELPKGWQINNTIGLNFSPLVAKRNKNSGAAVKELINHILNTTDSTIALTPHVIQEGNNDYEELKDYYNQFKNTERVILLPDYLDATQYKGYISRMRFFIGARTHATIAAYSTHVPTLVLGYSIKSKGIAQDIFGEEKLVLSIEQISNSENLISKFDEMLRDEDILRKKLQETIPNIKNLSYQAVDYLNELAHL